MSEPLKGVKFHSPRFWSVPARLANRFGIVTPVQVVEEAANDIRESVRRNLETNYSDLSETQEQPVNDNLNQTRSGVSRVTFRRNYSPLSVDNSMFEPNTNRNMENIPPELVDREIERLRTQTGSNTAAQYEDAGQPVESVSNALLAEVIHNFREMQEELRHLREQMRDLQFNQGNINLDNAPLDVTYGRTINDVRNQSAHTGGYLRLKEARDMIPEFDGNSQTKLKEFLCACSYAIKNINPVDERTLLEAILCTKLKGKAMTDFETRDINSFGQLKRELETCYLSKKSITHLQIEFNSLKQKSGESARTYGLRVDNLAMELYESMIEGQDFSSERRRIILDTIQQQALQNFQIGLHDDIKLLVRAQHYATLQEAIAGASAEEKVKGPTEYTPRHKSNQHFAQSARSKPLQCHKYGKVGHLGRECRTSRYATRFPLPKPQGNSRVNILQKHCTYCKKSGHDRKECWSLNGRPTTLDRNRRDEENKPRNKYKGDDRKGGKTRRRTSDSEGSSEEEGQSEEGNKTTHARHYQVTHVRHKQHKTIGLDQVRLPICETKEGKLNMLYDSGATISLIKVKHLKGETVIYKNKITLVGITGHQARTIGKIYATINLADRKIKHEIHVVKDDFPMESEGLIGLDFIRKHRVLCDQKKRIIKIGKNVLKLQPYDRIVLKPRSETIVQAATDQNKTGVIRAIEITPGIVIGRCLVKPKNNLCPISVINTTDEAVEIRTPLVTVEEINGNNMYGIYTVQGSHLRKHPTKCSRQI